MRDQRILPSHPNVPGQALLPLPIASSKKVTEISPFEATLNQHQLWH